MKAYVWEKNGIIQPSIQLRIIITANNLHYDNFSIIEWQSVTEPQTLTQIEHLECPQIHIPLNY